LTGFRGVEKTSIKPRLFRNIVISKNVLTFEW
jgi:hypothetical protein